MRRVLAVLAVEVTCELTGSEDVSLHGFCHLIFVRRGGEGQGGVHRVEREDVSVGGVSGRTWAGVADARVAVCSLTCAIG